MPSQPLKPCRHPGCPELVASGYCARHTQQQAIPRAIYDSTKRKDNPALALAARIRSGITWQKVRRVHRIREPLCRDPFNDHANDPRPNTNSHHIVPLAERPDLAYDLDNLAGLCTACHAKVEAMERAGRATRGLFQCDCKSANIA